MTTLIGKCECCEYDNESLCITYVVHDENKYRQLLCDSCLEGIERLGFVACHQCDYLHDGYDKEFCLPCKNELWEAINYYAEKVLGVEVNKQSELDEIGSSNEFNEWLKLHWQIFKSFVSKSDYFSSMTYNIFTYSDY